MDKAWDLFQQLNLLALERSKVTQISDRGITIYDFAYRSQHHSYK